MVLILLSCDLEKLCLSELGDNWRSVATFTDKNSLKSDFSEFNLSVGSSVNSYFLSFQFLQSHLFCTFLFHTFSYLYTFAPTGFCFSLLWKEHWPWLCIIFHSVSYIVKSMCVWRLELAVGTAAGHVAVQVSSSSSIPWTYTLLDISS